MEEILLQILKLKHNKKLYKKYNKCLLSGSAINLWSNFEKAKKGSCADAVTLQRFVRLSAVWLQTNLLFLHFLICCILCVN